MHPAPSVIIFTALSGLGFGLFAWLGFGARELRGWEAFGFYLMAYGLSVSGLLSSMFHLGHPERFLKAFSQWRTSWLSREGVLSVATLLLFAPPAIMGVFLGAGLKPLEWVAACLACATVLSTSMIYAQLKTVPRWNHWPTPVGFALYSLGGGAVLAGQAEAGRYILAALPLAQVLIWMAGDTRLRDSGSSIETATGLGRLGKVRSLEAPHTGANYLLTEMAHVVGRRHRIKLRILCVALLSLSAAALLAVPAGLAATALCLAFHLAGVFVSRWLFFAEAEHVVGFYYGKR